MDRRGFIGSILAACAAPAIVRADSLVRIVPMDTGLLYGQFSIGAVYRMALDTHYLSAEIDRREIARLVARINRNFNANLVLDQRL